MTLLIAVKTKRLLAELNNLMNRNGKHQNQILQRGWYHPSSYISHTPFKIQSRPHFLGMKKTHQFVVLQACYVEIHTVPVEELFQTIPWESKGILLGMAFDSEKTL